MSTMTEFEKVIEPLIQLVDECMRDLKMDNIRSRAWQGIDSKIQSFLRSTAKKMLSSGKDKDDVVKFLESVGESVYDNFDTVNSSAKAWELRARIETNFVPSIKNELGL